MIGLSTFFGCSEEEPAEKIQFPTTAGVSGTVQKGFFLRGSNVTLQVLDDDFNPTGQSYTVSTTDEFGSFALESAIVGVYLESIASGYYFNEVSGEISTAPITLRALTPIGEDLKVNVNVLTTLSKDRVITLVKEEGLSFAEATAQAGAEILSVFNIPFDPAYDFIKMDIREDGAAHAVLLAASSVLQGSLTVVELSQLLSKLSLDIEDHGAISDQATTDLLRENATQLIVREIKNNLIQRYTDLGSQFPIPPFERFVKRLVDLSVIRTSPAAMAKRTYEDVGAIMITFSKALAETTFNDTSLKLLLPDGGSVAGEISYNADSFRIEFRPLAELLPDVTYRVVITDAVLGLDDTPFAGYEFQFETVGMNYDPTLLAYYTFNGTTEDVSGHKQHAVSVNVAYGSDIYGQMGKACSFGGEGSYLEIPNVINMTTPTWTYSLWFYLDQFPQGVAPFLLASRLSANAFWDVPLYMRPSVKAITSYNGGVAEVTNLVEIHKWYHVAMVIDNGTIAMYINGELKASKSSFWSTQSNPGYEDFLGDAVGSYEYYTGKYYISEKFRGESFPGYMYGSVDNVRFYNRALNLTDIQTLFKEKK